MKKRLLAISLIFTLLMACDKDDSDEILINAKHYFPLEIGNSWEYEHCTRSVTGTKLINGKEYFVVSEQTTGLDGQYAIYIKDLFFRTTNSKVYQLYNDKSDEFILANFSLGEHESWKYKSNDSNDQYWHVEVLPDIDLTIGKTNIKNCKAFLYDVPQWADEEQTMSFAPGFGQVKSSSIAWGLSNTLQKAKIKGIEYEF